MFPARPPPEGAKSVFAHNLHSLTRPSLPTNRGTWRSVYEAQQRYYPAVFSPFFLHSSLNCWITSLSICPFISIFQV